MLNRLKKEYAHKDIAHLEAILSNSNTNLDEGW